MIKLIVLVEKKPGLSDDEFITYYKSKHVPLALKIIPGLRKFTLSHVIRSPDRKANWDAVTELWFDDMNAYQHYVTWRTAEGQVMGRDAQNFLDTSKTQSFVANEYIMKE